MKDRPGGRIWEETHAGAEPHNHDPHSSWPGITDKEERIMRSITSGLRRRCVVVGIAAAVSAGIVSGGALASSASAAPCNIKQCAWANLEYKGGFLGSNGYGAAYPNYTEVGGPYEGCTHTSFNDCASSIWNVGGYTTYYYENAYYGGGQYTNNPGTGASFLGSYWNDTFSSDVIG